MSKEIVIINGSGGVGKDAFVEFCNEFTCVKNISSVDKVKEAAKVLVNWDGTKDDKPTFPDFYFGKDFFIYSYVTS